MLCDDVERWNGGGWEGHSRGKGYMYTYSYLLIAQQKLTQHCKAILIKCTVSSTYGNRKEDQRKRKETVFKSQEV